MCEYCNLHAHSDNSLLDGAVTPMERARLTEAMGQTSLSISDHGTLMGVPDHIKACKEYGIKPHVGIEAYFKPDRLKQDKHNKKSFHLLLTAQNEIGWKNLIKLSSEAYESGFYYKPNMDYALLKDHSEGVIASSGCISGYLPRLILDGAPQHEIDECINRHLEIFGDNYYFEIMPHDLNEQRIVNQHLVKYSLDYGVPLLATNDSHYGKNEDASTQDVLLMIATGQSRNQREKKKEAGEEVYEMGEADTLHMMGMDEMAKKFAKYHYDIPAAVIKKSLLESGKISDKIEEFELSKKIKIPKLYDTKEEARKQLESWCQEGMERIGKSGVAEYELRLDYELSVVYDMEVEEYFVLAANLVRWARDKGIRISSGRGSAAASLINYLTKVTMLDPIAHKYKFARFLNKNRKGMPDIDLDFDPERIPEVIEYLEKLLGKDHVCHISAVGTYKPKSAIKDVARVLNVPFEDVNAVTKVIPDPPNQPPLEILYKEYPEVADFLDSYPEVKKHAFKIEGMKKQLSRHAAGILVSPFPITDEMPIIRGKESMVTGFTDTAGAEWVTGLGWMKLDILSIDGLTKQGKIIESIYKRTGKRINLDELSVATDPDSADPKVLEILASGRNEGIWQFRSKGASNFIKGIGPTSFYDIAVANALYRPGALDGGDAFKYADCKHGKDVPTYWHPSVKPYLESTYGIVAFQEQLMEIAEELGGYTPEDADDLRKTVSKLYRLGKAEAAKVMNENKPKFVEGCKSNGLTEEEADLVWERFLAFSGYGFNYIHASSYGFTAYQDAYLKAYYPMDFYAAHLSDTDEVASLVREARFSDIIVSPPDINISEDDFTIMDDKILYGLRAVKYIGGEAVKTIVRTRKHELYTSPTDFRLKVAPKKVNKRGLDYLVKAGAFDSLGEREGLTKQEKRELEAEAIGVELTGSEDALQYAHILESRIKTEKQVEEAADGTGLTVGGEITAIKQIEIKRGKFKGKPMAFVDISYKMDSYSCTVFTDKFYKYEDLLSEGNIVIVRGRKSDRGGLLLDTMARLEDLAQALEKEKHGNI